MSDIRCPKCGNSNPDFLDACQFCQTPLRAESVFHIGDEPTKKDTGELEEILPSWLKDARKQSKEETGGDATLRSETKPKVQRSEAPDLLSGLMSQADSDDDEVPDWLASINPVAEKNLSKAPSAKEDGPSDFFAQFKQSEPQPSKPPVSEPAQDDTPAWMKGMEKPVSAPKDELTDWLSQTPAETTAPAFVPASEPVADDNSWMNNLGSFDDAAQPPVEKEPEDLSWLHDLENSAKQPDGSSTSQQSAGFDFAPSSDGEDLSWLNTLGGISAPSFEQPAQPASSNAGDDMSWLNSLGGTPAPSFEEPAQSKPANSDEDLSWLNSLGGTPAPSFEEPAQSKPASSDEDMSWLNSLGGTPAPSFEEPAQSKPASSDEDLSWLNSLGGTPAPSFEQPAQSKPASSDEDLSWLNSLGSTPAPTFEEPAQPKPASSDEDLSWLNSLGGDTPAPTFEQPAQPAPTSKDDLDWLSNLGGTTAPASEQPAQPASASQDDLDWLSNLGGTPAPASAQPAQPASASQDDLDWLSNLGGTAPAFEQPAQPTSASQDDLDWLSNLGGTSAPAFEQPAAFDQQESQPSEPVVSKPFQTAPLNELLKDDAIKDVNPDWLKSALEEEASMPSLDDLSVDRRFGQGKPADAERPASSQPAPASPQPAFDLPFGDSSTPSSSDIDSLFNIDMPDWLSREAESADAQPGVDSSSGAGDASLAPVELPSWVQAMRPVGSSIGDDIESTGKLNQVTESEGPLAGFSGVIPSAPIGSALRPKAFSLKLQVTEEQQAGALLFEQILASETTAQTLKPTSAVASQRVLRWVLSGMFIIVLALVLGLGLQTMPIVPSNQLSDLVATVPDSSSVLVILDYEPSLAGELEATGGPLLNQLALARRSTFTFVAMSPTGSALADRLVSNTIIKSAPQGLEYQLGTQYFNPGFLPGGSAGVLGFIADPVKAMPYMNIDKFSKFQAIILMTDNAESGRVWVEQLEIAKIKDPGIAEKPLFVVSSAQSAPILQPYASSGQVDIVINGLYDAAKYEYVNTSRPGIVRNYWDAFGVGLFMAIIAIVLGSVWSILMGIRERRLQAEQG